MKKNGTSSDENRQLGKLRYKLCQNIKLIAVHSLFIRHIASFMEIYIRRYHFILLCVYLNMQRTLNSAEKTTQLLTRINETLPNISMKFQVLELLLVVIPYLI